MKAFKDLTPEEKKIFWQRVELYGGLFVIFLSLFIFLRIYNTRLIKGDGILPTPRRAVAPLEITYYAQDDPAWANDPLGETGYTMAQEGSLFACLSMVLETNDISVTPQELNRRFIENKMYLQGKVANVTALNTLYPSVHFSAPKDFDGEDITKILRSGKACMVRVMRGEHVHWLCVVGATDVDFYVLDPAGGKELKMLADYGNVYALGIVR